MNRNWRWYFFPGWNSFKLFFLRKIGLIYSSIVWRYSSSVCPSVHSKQSCPKVDWHSPQLKQGDSCFNHYCIGWYHAVFQCLTQCPQARLYCSRMPYGAVLYIFIYADCICSPFFKMLIPALTSLPCFVWHSGHSQLRTARSFTSGFLYPQQLQVWLLGYIVGTLMMSFPYHAALYLSM